MSPTEYDGFYFLPGDDDNELKITYFEFTGGTPSGCYRIVNKIDAAPTDGTTPLYFYSLICSFSPDLGHVDTKSS